MRRAQFRVNHSPSGPDRGMPADIVLMVRMTRRSREHLANVTVARYLSMWRHAR